MSDSNKPAFPRPGFTASETESQEGMTLLEYYAGQILAGMLASYVAAGDPEPAKAAKKAVAYAKALILELNEHENP